MNNSHIDVWEHCLRIIRDNIDAHRFKVWFLAIKPLKLERNVLTVQVPSHFFYEYIEAHYIDILKRSLRKVLGNGAKLEYNIVVDKSSLSNEAAKSVNLPAKDNVKLKNRPVSLGEQNEKVPIRNPFIIPGLKTLNIDPNLNPNNNFDNFVEGDSNRLARSAGYAVANKPGGTAFNPLFIYGQSGLGKTHLAQAVGIEIKKIYPQKIVLYVPANLFQIQYSDAAIGNNRNEFLNFYQLVDVLIIDDVQEFIGKDKTQDTFFHIFNYLHQNQKQLILTSDKPPAEMSGLTDRLLSRFKWGLSAEIQRPDYETRIAILKQRLYRDGITLSNDIIEYLATHVSNNIRELEGVLISIMGQATFTKQEITLESVKKMVEKIVKTQKKEITVQKIKSTVSEYFNIQTDAIISKSRKREIVQARQIAMYFSKNYTKESLANIGAQFGGKDHATVLHAHRTVSNLMETDRKYRFLVHEVEKKLLS